MLCTLELIFVSITTISKCRKKVYVRVDGTLAHIGHAVMCAIIACVFEHNK